jgi:plastocyanin
VTAILREAIAKVNVFPTPPSFIVHTGDLTHLLRPVLAGNTVDQSASAELKIDNFSSSPANLTVAAGTMVTWINRDDIPHVAVSSDDPRAFKSKGLDTDERFSFTFTKAGSYPHFCAIHPKMTGQVIVQ